MDRVRQRCSKMTVTRKANVSLVRELILFYDNSPSQKFYIGACEAVYEVRKGYRLATPTIISGSVKLDLISIA